MATTAKLDVIINTPIPRLQRPMPLIYRLIKRTGCRSIILIIRMWVCCGIQRPIALCKFFADCIFCLNLFIISTSHRHISVMNGMSLWAIKTALINITSILWYIGIVAEFVYLIHFAHAVVLHRITTIIISIHRILLEIWSVWAVGHGIINTLHYWRHDFPNICLWA